MSAGERRKITVSLDPEQADVLDAIAHLNGHTGRAGAWVGDQLRSVIERRRTDPDVATLLKARQQYQSSRPDRIRHGLGVIDGGAA